MLPFRFSNPVVSVFNVFFTFSFFFFKGADIVQWLMKNLSIEDPGKVTTAGKEQITVCIILYTADTILLRSNILVDEKGWFKHWRKGGWTQIKVNILIQSNTLHCNTQKALCRSLSLSEIVSPWERLTDFRLFPDLERELVDVGA